MDARSIGAMQLLASAVASVADPDGTGVGMGDLEELERGVAATLHVPSGDRYRMTVEWLGDRESEGGE